MICCNSLVSLPCPPFASLYFSSIENHELIQVARVPRLIQKRMEEEEEEDDDDEEVVGRNGAP